MFFIFYGDGWHDVCNIIYFDAMNKIQLVDAVTAEVKVTKLEAKKIVDAVIKVTLDTLQRGDKVTLTGFGTFSIVVRSERRGRNPRTGAIVKIPSKRVIKFRPTAGVEDSCLTHVSFD